MSEQENNTQTAPHQRTARTFVPGQEQTLAGPPETISGDPAATGVDYADRPLDARPVRGLKWLLGLLAIYLVVALGVDGYGLVHRAWSTHWIWGGLVAALLLGLVVAALVVAASWLRGGDSLKGVIRLQGQAQQLRAARSQGQAGGWLAALGDFYAEKPQAAALARAVDGLPDYVDDGETVAHVEQVFLKPLDQQAYRQITRYSAHAGVAVGLSLWPLLDMALTLWRNARLVEAVAKTYGVRPGFDNRLRILLFVLKNMAFAGATQMASDYVTAQSASTVLPKVAGGVGQGLGVALISVRIGLLTMRACRPVPFEKGRQRGMGGFVKEVGEAVLASRKG
ncbi:TIGR01620 family protein [Motiliproteus sp. SC1-56]|uniref:TIGR01620 family protein n=1 Tax=Motiliproteus sp. SC1-56 TaxID=2799565 RepID=UPI001A908BDC|nr:TIGR01620 family protein [Motiliproteus sp. SC1-56]